MVGNTFFPALLANSGLPAGFLCFRSLSLPCQFLVDYLCASLLHLLFVRANFLFQLVDLVLFALLEHSVDVVDKRTFPMPNSLDIAIFPVVDAVLAVIPYLSYVAGQG